MPEPRRRGSLPQRHLPSHWLEVAAPVVASFLLSEDDPELNRSLWHVWMRVCMTWATVVYTTRGPASQRLLSDSSMSLRIKLWRCVLGVPEDVDSQEFTSLIMDGSYSAWAEISRDSRRTFASILRKRPQLHLQLTRILHALSSRFRDVGYCQGMNFVAGTVLLAVNAVTDSSILSLEPVVQSSTPPTVDEPVVPQVAPPDTFIAVIQEKNHSPSERVSFKLCEKVLLRNHFVRMYALGLHTRLTIWTFDKLVESIYPDIHDIIINQLQVSADVCVVIHYPLFIFLL